MIFMCMFMLSYIINSAKLCDISLHVRSYILTLGYDYLNVHSYLLCNV